MTLRNTTAEMSDPTSLGKRLRRLREARGWTQQDLADRLSLDRSTVSCYEAGRRTPDIHMADKIAALFGIGVDSLLGRANEPMADGVGEGPVVYEPDPVAVAFRRMTKDLPPEDREELARVLEFHANQIRQRRKREKGQVRSDS